MKSHIVLEILEALVLCQEPIECEDDVARDDAAAVVVEGAIGELQYFGFLVEAARPYDSYVLHDRPGWRDERKSRTENHRRAGGQLKVRPEVEDVGHAHLQLVIGARQAV
jgi:hypothetical protein